MDEARVEEAILFTDGAARGNPGPAGAGFLLVTPQGDAIEEGRVPLPDTTNNVAEYEAVVHGLDAARRLGVRVIELRSDSQLLIRQLQGQYKVRAAHLQPLYQRARRQLDEFVRVRLVHVRRELNTDADRLANEAIDGSKGEAPDKKRKKKGRAGSSFDELVQAALRLERPQRAKLLEQLRDSLR